MTLPNPIPDNPLKWDGWRNYNSPNLYERLCLDYTGNTREDVIEDNTRQLLIWWQKKLPLKNQPSNPMAQLLRQGLDEAPQFLAEARTRLLDINERSKHDDELHSLLVGKAILEFKKLIAFTISDKRLTENSEARLLTAGGGMGLRPDEIATVIEAELERTGSARVKPEPVAPPPPRPAPMKEEPAYPQRVPVSPLVPPEEKDPSSEFRKLLLMSRLCLDGEEMSDDNRDAMCNLGESLGLTGGQAEDLIDEYLEKMANTLTPVSKPVLAVRPVTTPVRPVDPAVAPAVKIEINLSPIARADERRRFPNYKSFLDLDMLLVPAGQFLMGSDTADSQGNEQPVTLVTLSAFYMARYPVTNGMFEKFDPAHQLKRAPWADQSHPVVYVSSLEAEEFCKWLSQREGRKYRLPTEAEWEYAARGGDTRIFPWGDRTISGNVANFADVRTQFAWRESRVDDGFAESAPVGSFPRGASPFGVEDMAGNVFEWCLDSLEPYKGREIINPKVLKQTTKRVYRGGSWKSRVSSLRCCARNANVPTYQSNDVGFRIVCECE